MYLSDPLVRLIFESGNHYVASLERSTDTIRLFWEDDKHGPNEGEEGEYQCFTTFDFVEDGEQLSLEEIGETAESIITARKLEPEDSLVRTIEHEIRYSN